MNVRPILMHARSAQNLLAGRKTQTRRIVKPQPPAHSLGAAGDQIAAAVMVGHEQCRYGKPGDLLWVRESITLRDRAPHGLSYPTPYYRADVTDPYGLCFSTDDGFCRYVEQLRWTPSIHMPRKWSRLTLELTDVRVERVKDISEADALAEGIVVPPTPSEYRDATGERVLPHTRTARLEFIGLWNDTNGPGAWERNDWVWVLAFKVHRLNVDTFIQRVTAHETGCRPFRETA